MRPSTSIIAQENVPHRLATVHLVEAFSQLRSFSQMTLLMSSWPKLIRHSSNSTTWLVICCFSCPVHIYCFFMRHLYLFWRVMSHSLPFHEHVMWMGGCSFLSGNDWVTQAREINTDYPLVAIGELKRGHCCRNKQRHSIWGLLF